ncbi:MAG: CPBP family glutamic-type intramembrane protease [Gemmatimonadota bacterium]
MFDRYRSTPLYILPFPPLIVALLALFDRHQRPELIWLASAVGLGVMLVAMLGAGRLRADDVGLDRDMLARGIGITLMTWAATQVIGVLPRVVAEDPVAIHRSWLHGNRLKVGGHFVAGFSTATLEEVALRGFLLVQLYLLFHHDPKDSNQGLTRALAFTVLTGNAIALIATWPVASTRDLLLTQALAAGLGLYLSWIYLRTRNLFFAIGVHTLILAPTPVMAGLRGEPEWFFPVVVAAVAAVWVLLWPRRD